MAQARTTLLVFFYILLILIAIPLLLFCYLTGLRTPPIAYGKWAMRVSQFVLGIKIETSGLEHADPSRARIYMPNHLSFIDGPLLVTFIPGFVRVIVKKEVFRVPVLGQAMRFVGFVPVDRKRARGGRRSIERAAEMMRGRSYSFLIFPEGTRSLDGTMGPFRRGGFFLALESGAPIVPVTIRGTFELMPKGQWYARRGRVQVVFHEPVPVTGYAAETIGALMGRVRAAIAEDS